MNTRTGTMTTMTQRILSGLMTLFTCGLAWAQPMGFLHHGNFTHMARTGEAVGQVRLSTLDTTRGVWGVGALAGFKGEVIQVDGQLLVSPGSAPRGEVRPAEGRDTAALWASAKVSQWEAIPVTTDMSQAQLEAFIQAQATARQIDLSQPFVFRVTGEQAHLVWHVVTGEKAVGGAREHAGHGQASGGGGGGPGHANHANHANHAAGMKVFRQPQARGQLIGVYSGAALEGVVSHPGERFHVHHVSDDLQTSGHVDQYTVRAGSTLWLPRP